MFDLFFCFLGIFFGFFLGLIPGMHINNFLPFLIFLPFTSTQFFFFVISASVSFAFSSFFPSILLGVPNQDTALNVLPGHRLVLEGRAYTALVLSLLGGLFALFFSVFFLFLFLFFLPVLYPFIRLLIPFLLVIICIIILISDRKPVFIVFFLSSVLGFLTFSYDLLLPLLSGFFGLSTLLISVMRNPSIPMQVPRFNSTLSFFKIIRCSFISCFLSSIFGLIPAVSSTISACTGKIFGKLNSEEFITLLGGTNVIYMIYSFFTFFLVRITRSGSAVFLAKIMESQNILFSFGIILFSGVIAALL